jgi:hypothetical protein
LTDAQAARLRGMSAKELRADAKAMPMPTEPNFGTSSSRPGASRRRPAAALIASLNACELIAPPRSSKGHPRIRLPKGLRASV